MEDVNKRELKRKHVGHFLTSTNLQHQHKLPEGTRVPWYAVVCACVGTNHGRGTCVTVECHPYFGSSCRYGHTTDVLLQYGHIVIWNKKWFNMAIPMVWP